MTIDVFTGALFAMMFILMGFIIGLHGKINDLKNEILCYNKRLMTIQDKAEAIYDMTDVLDNRLDPIMFQLNKIQEIVVDSFEFIDEYDEDEPEEDDEDEEPEPGELELRVEVDELPIHLITPNQYLFEAGYDKFELEYSETSDILVYYYGTDEDSWENIVIDNVTECVGDALKFFGVNAKDDRHVYVRNNIFHADFRIVKVN